MRFYLSSYKVGNEYKKLQEMIGGSTLGFIPNAIDHISPDEWIESNNKNMKDLTDLGIQVELIDLKDYFGKADILKEKINSLGGIRVRGGNTYVLRQAMALSGLDNIVCNMKNPDFIYGGYSAGPCVLGPTLKHFDIVDDPYQKPYGAEHEIIWDGLGLLPYTFVPHYKSDHHESAAIDQEIERYIEHKILFKAFRDGEVLIM